MLVKKYSGKEIIKAGEKLIEDYLPDRLEEFEQVLDVLSYWRFSHEKPLAEALALLRTESIKIDRTAIFAKRLKRYISIKNKLHRFKSMKLKNMQDIGGCRAIVSNQKKLMQIVRVLKQRKEFRGDKGKLKYKDYISHPKDDGYRGYHLIGEFKDLYGDIKNIEVQIRTRLQHDWATAVEIVDLFTRQSLKSNQGNEDWQLFFKYVSEQFSLMESVHLFSLKDLKKQSEYEDYVRSHEIARKSCLNVKTKLSTLDVINKLQGFANSIKIIEDKLQQNDGYVLIEINTAKSEVRTTIFNDNQNQAAEKKYIEAEKASVGKEKVVALVYASSLGEIKEAYPNYFADSTDFLLHLELVNKLKLY